MERADALQRLREQVRVRPGDGEAWRLLASLESDPATQEAALRKAVALLPGNASAYSNLAWHLIQAGRAEEALPFATNAALRAPWDPEILDTYAACLFALGRCPDALRVQHRAVDNLPESDRNTRAAQNILAAVSRYEDACGGQKPGETPRSAP